MDHGSENKRVRDLVLQLESSMDKKPRLGFLKGGPLGPQSSSRTGRDALRVNICTYLQHTGGLQVNIIHIYTREQVYVQFVHNSNNTGYIMYICTY